MGSPSPPRGSSGRCETATLFDAWPAGDCGSGRRPKAMYAATAAAMINAPMATQRPAPLRPPVGERSSGVFSNSTSGGSNMFYGVEGRALAWGSDDDTPLCPCVTLVDRPVKTTHLEMTAT